VNRPIENSKKVQGAAVARQDGVWLVQDQASGPPKGHRHSDVPRGAGKRWGPVPGCAVLLPDDAAAEGACRRETARAAVSLARALLRARCAQEIGAPRALQIRGRACSSGRKPGPGAESGPPPIAVDWPPVKPRRGEVILSACGGRTDARMQAPHPGPKPYGPASSRGWRGRNRRRVVVMVKRSAREKGR